MSRLVNNVLALSSIVSIAACAHSTRQPAGTPSYQYLFVQVARSGTIDGDRLTLRDVGAQTIFFSDRPQRVTGHLPVAEFVRLWTQGPSSFRDDPPNASLALVARDANSTAVFELRDPVLEGTSLSFRVRLLQGSPPQSFTDASLFIDAGGLMQLVAYSASSVWIPVR